MIKEIALFRLGFPRMFRGIDLKLNSWIRSILFRFKGVEKEIQLWNWELLKSDTILNDFLLWKCELNVLMTSLYFWCEWPLTMAFECGLIYQSRFLWRISDAFKVGDVLFDISKAFFVRLRIFLEISRQFWEIRSKTSKMTLSLSSALFTINAWIQNWLKFLEIINYTHPTQSNK